jgi:hypothetical protein
MGLLPMLEVDLEKPDLDPLLERVFAPILDPLWEPDLELDEGVGVEGVGGHGTMTPTRTQFWPSSLLPLLAPFLVLLLDESAEPGSWSATVSVETVGPIGDNEAAGLDGAFLVKADFGLELGKVSNVDGSAGDDGHGLATISGRYSSPLLLLHLHPFLHFPLLDEEEVSQMDSITWQIWGSLGVDGERVILLEAEEQDVRLDLDLPLPLFASKLELGEEDINKGGVEADGSDGGRGPSTSSLTQVLTSWLDFLGVF